MCATTVHGQAQPKPSPCSAQLRLWLCRRGAAALPRRCRRCRAAGPLPTRPPQPPQPPLAVRRHCSERSVAIAAAMSLMRATSGAAASVVLGFGFGFGFGFRLGLGLGLGRLVHEHHGRHDGEMPHTVAATVVEGPWLGLWLG